MRLSMEAQTGRDAPAHLTLTGVSAFNQTWTINKTLQPISVDLEVPPDGTELRFTCDGQPIDAARGAACDGLEPGRCPGSGTPGRPRRCRPPPRTPLDNRTDLEFYCAPLG